MFKRAVCIVSLFLLTLVCCGSCQSDAWYRGCYKQNTSQSCFNLTAGDYHPLVNLTAEACVTACLSLNFTITFAGLTANGICLCTQSDDICLEPVSNTSCYYSQSDAWYYKVYRVSTVPTLHAPLSVMVFEEFNISIGSADPNCSYTLDYDDGMKSTLFPSSTQTMATHYYVSVGEYQITISAPQCIPGKVTATVRSESKMSPIVSLDCPDETIEVTDEDKSCELSVLKGSGLNVTELDSGKFITTLPDTVVETIGFPTVDESSTVGIFPNGTYVMPFLSAANDGILTHIHFGVTSDGIVMIQIWSPKCRDGSKACRGGCVSGTCPQQTYNGEEMLSENSCTANITTESNSSTIYTVKEEFTISATEYSKLFQTLPKPITITRGDVIAFHVTSVAAISTSQHNASYVLFYCNQSFSVDDDVKASDATQQMNVMFIPFRLYIATPVTLNIPIKPELPKVDLAYDVSSLSDSKEIRETVQVQERISGLEILSPLTGVYYPTLENILFSFNVSNGTNVNYTVDPGNGTVFLNTTGNHLKHNYKTSGNYTFMVTASNDINSVNTSQRIAVVDDIKNLTFVEDPKLKPGEVGVTYVVNVSLEAGDKAMLLFDFGNNISVFVSCGDINKSIGVPVSYTKAGTYNITVTAFGLIAGRNLSIDSSVQIMERIKNVTVYQEKNGPLAFIKDQQHIEKHLVHETLKLVVKVSSGWPISYNFSVTGPVKYFVKLDKQNASIKFPRTGEWTINILVRNDVSKKKYTITVNVLDYCMPSLEIYDRRTKEKPFQTFLGNDIRINTEVVHNESCPDFTRCSKYNWTLILIDNKDVELPDHIRDKIFFFIDKTSMKDPGLYKVMMSAVCNGTRSRGETYFNVKASDPIPIISGGDQREVIAGGMIILDASTSYDPNIELFNSFGLSFNWTVNCSDVKLLRDNISRVEINGTSLTAGTVFEVYVNVTTSSRKHAQGKQIISVVGENVPVTEIICHVNCLPFVIPTDRLSLEGKCSSCNHSANLAFEWIIYNSDKGERAEIKETDTTTRFDKENLVISPNTLKRNTTYSVSLKTTQNGVSSLSVYEFKTSGYLTGGKCKIIPSKGISLETEFHVECSKWQGGRFPLTYSIRYESPVETVRGYEWILWYNGQENKSPKTKLPAGRNNTNYTIPIVVDILGTYGEYAKENFSVQVMKQQTLDTNALLKDIEDLDQVVGKEEPQKLAQKITTIAQVLNAKQASQTSDVTDKELRNNLVKQVSKIEAKTLPLIQQTSNALKLAVSDSKEVTHDTQESGVAKLKELSENLLAISSKSTTRTGEEIDKTAEIVLSGLSKILSATFFTGRDTSKKDAPEKVKPNLYGTLSKKGSDLKKIGEKTREVVQVLDETVKIITTAMAKKKLNGEKPTVVKTPKLNLTLRKLSKSQVKNDGFQHSESGRHTESQPSIFFPKKSSIFGKKRNETENIFIETITFQNNPYTWDIRSSHYIQPAVFSFNFRNENGDHIPINNLQQEIDIRLPNRRENIVYRPLNSSEEKEEFLLYSFQIVKDHYEEVVLIEIRHSESIHQEPTFYLKFGEKVSPTNYDCKGPLSVNMNCPYATVVKDNQSHVVFIRDSEKVKSVKGIVSVGLLPCPKQKQKPCNFKNHTYEIFVQTVSCRYWNYSEWIKHGCKVGNKSKPSQTSCLCNHLTAFGSYIVKPNPLNKFSAEDFRNGFVCFVVVAVIFCFYFIFLVWARKADRSDCSKVGVCALSDNGPQDRYRYEIAIWTGMRRNAGTASEVTIILSGEKNDSEPRCLVNPQNPTFTRASLEKFLLTSSKDIGSLYCIRIWHDNSKGSWFLSRVMVTDLQRNERFYFICDRWLAVDEDDGQVERLLPVASDEELADFHHLFYSKTKRGLSDTHLWVSVINRPPQSIFTRVQRLSCCLCILMTTMVANAMFYRTRSEPKADTTNYVGSYSFTWDEVYIGIVSSLIVVPINVIILNIFRNVRPKPRKTRRQSKALSVQNLDSGSRNFGASFESLVESSDQGTRESITKDTEINLYSRMRSAGLRKKRDEKLSLWAKFKRFIMPSSLPHCFVYLAWAILVIVTLGSATVVILYGMQFGNGRSLQWLFSITISIIEDIFVLQPLKVLVFALAFALLVKKPDEGEFEMSDDYDEDDEVQQQDISGSPIPEKRVPSSPRLPVRPTEEQLSVMRKARMKERKMFFLIQEIIIHLIFMIIIALVTYGHKDTRSVHLFRHIDELSQKTEKMTNFTYFWNWSRIVLVPKAFPEKLYNGHYVSSYGFFDDGYNNLISKARMRLLRVNSDNCTVASEFKDKIGECLQDYSIFNQDELCYRSNWNAVTKRWKKDHWCFQNWKDLDGYPTLGIFNTYSGSGYVKEIRPGDDNNKTMNVLESSNWLNKRSRALFVEMTTYNANINLYTSITLLFEFPEFGGIFFFRNIIPMRLKLYVGGFAFFIFACEMAFALFVLGYTYVALKKLYHYKMAYFKNFWNIMDFSILMSSFAAIAVYVYRLSITTKLMRTVQDRDGEFVNFQYVTYWNEILSYIMALVVSLTTVKLTKLMRFNLRISLFGKTLQDAKPALAGFSIQFGIVFFAYVMVGVLVFGYNVSQFRSIVSAMMALGRVILGKSQFAELFSADPIIGPLFFFTYVTFVCWILVTMVVAILTDSYHEVQDRCFGMSNEYEMVDFLIARIRAWSGFGKKKDRIPANERWRKAGVKAKAAAKLGRQRSYKPSAENVAFEKTGDLMEKLEDSIRCLEKKVNKLCVEIS